LLSCFKKTHVQKDTWWGVELFNLASWLMERQFPKTLQHTRDQLPWAMFEKMAAHVMKI
jgi:hypothetical protein